MSDLGIRDAMLAALVVGAALLVGYQIFMLRWTKKVAGQVPTVVKVLRGVNIAVLVGAVALVIWSLAR